METSTKQLNLKTNKTSLYTHRPLLSIDKFAAHHGISKNIIEECAKLGLIKTRKYRGRIFILDIPTNPYQDTFKNSNKQLRQEALQAVKIAELAKKIPADDPKTNTIQTKRPSVKTEPVDKIKEKNAFTKTDAFLLGLSARQSKAKIKWQLTALSAVILFAATIFVNIWLYTDRNIKIDTIANYDLSYRKMYEDAAQAHNNSKLLHDELNAYKAELDSISSTLTRTTQYLGIVQKQNVKDAEDLNRTIRDLANELTDPLTTP